LNEREVLPGNRKDFLCSERYFVVVLVRVRLLDGFSFWQVAPFKITMISPVFLRVSAIFGNPFPSWRGVLLDGHCATQKDIA
jgi:hypothetical protein